MRRLRSCESCKPTRGSLAWYAGISVMAAAGLVEWPLVAGHLIEENSRSQAISSAAGGVVSGAG